MGEYGASGTAGIKAEYIWRMPEVGATEPTGGDDGLEKSVVATLKQDCSFRALSNATKLPNSLLASWLAFASRNKLSVAIVRRIRNARDMMDWQSYPQISSCLHWARLGSKLVAQQK